MHAACLRLRHAQEASQLYVFKASVLDRAGFTGRDRYLVGTYDRDARFEPFPHSGGG